MLKLIWNSISKRAFQSFSLLLSVTVSVAVLFTLFAVYEGVSAGIETSSRRMGADIMLVPEDAAYKMEDADLLLTGVPAPIYLDQSVVDQVREIKGVSRVTVQFYGQTLSEPCCSTGTEARLVGFDPESDWIVGPWLGKELQGGLAEDQVIVGSGVSGFEGGEGRIRGQTFRVAGVLEPSGSGLDYSVLMRIDVLRRLAGGAEDFAIYEKMYGPAENLVSAVLLEVEPGKENLVSSWLQSLDGVRVIRTAGVLDNVGQQMGAVFLVIAGAAGLLAAAAVFQIFARFWTMTWDRRNELGLYRALGAAEGDLKILLLGEAAAFTGGGALLGVVAGWGLHKLLIAALLQNTPFPFLEPGPGQALLYAAGLLALFLFTGLLSVLAPLSQTAKIDPASAMQKRDID